MSEIKSLRAKNVSVAQIAIVCVLSRGNDIVPLIGACHRERLADSLGTLQVQLTTEDLAQIEQAIPAGAAAGKRYNVHQTVSLE